MRVQEGLSADIHSLWQGIQSAVDQVSSGQLATTNLRPGCVHSLLQPLAVSGQDHSISSSQLPGLLSELQTDHIAGEMLVDVATAVAIGACCMS